MYANIKICEYNQDITEKNGDREMLRKFAPILPEDNTICSKLSHLVFIMFAPKRK